MPHRQATIVITPVSAEVSNPQLGWNVAHDVGELLEYHFMVNALLAGSVVAVMAGVVGWVMVLRREAFAGHTLSMMAFPGASGALLIGIPAAWGYFAFCGAGALAIGRFSGRGRGSMLVLALLVAPAATAQLLTARPALSLVLSVLIGLLIVWLGMGIAYFSVYPAGFFISAIAFAVYLLARLSVGVRRRAASARAP